MSNTFAPFGLSQTGGNPGAAPNFEQAAYSILYSDTNKIYTGDPVKLGSNGYVAAWTAGTAVSQLFGIFAGCEYLSSSQGKVVWSNYWPGSDATGDVEAYVIDDPNTRFVVQTSGSSFQITGTNTTFTSSPVGQLAQLNVGSGSTTTQQSGMYLDTVGTTATYPFQIVDMVLDPPGSNGSDPTSNYNYVIVGFNNEMLRSNGAVTGIS